MATPQFLHRIDGIRHSAQFHLNTQHLILLHTLHSRFRHIETLLSRSSGSPFVRWNMGRHEPDLIQCMRVPCRFSCQEVSHVDRIKRTTHDADLHLRHAPLSR
ncbi:hypothetical protein D3C76_1519660 [compost metagenome]